MKFVEYVQPKYYGVKFGNFIFPLVYHGKSRVDPTEKKYFRILWDAFVGETENPKIIEAVVKRKYLQ